MVKIRPVGNLPLVNQFNNSIQRLRQTITRLHLDSNAQYLSSQSPSLNEVLFIYFLTVNGVRRNLIIVQFEL